MHKILPHLWFDKDAKVATEFYVSLLPDSRIDSVRTITGTPSGDCDIVSFTLAGRPMMAISAGPYFTPNPAISFMLNFDPAQDASAETRIDEVWAKLVEGGKVLMPLSEYPFSKRYGWVEDRYGFSWQLILTNPTGEMRPKVMPFFTFVGAVCGKAEEASDFYMSLFAESKRGTIVRHGKDSAPDKEGTAMFTDFTLGGDWFVAMDSAYEHKFAFNEAVSFVVYCDTQEEIDRYWSSLSAVPASEQCGWLKDKYGVSWQIVPSLMNTMMQEGSKAQTMRVTEAFLKMKKFDIATLKKAYEG